jgi:Putative Ig domain
VGACVGVGWYMIGNPVNNGNGIIDTLAHGVWTTRNAPVPNLPLVRYGDQLQDVACTSVGACVAVGLYNARKFKGEPGLIDTLSGGTWTARTAPLPVHATSGLNDVVCPAAGSCVATGFFMVMRKVTGGYTESFQGVIETEVGGRWVQRLAPLPSDAASDPQVFYLPVACPVVGSCVASGVYWNASQSIVALIETLSGGVASPAITSARSATFIVGQAGSFTVTTTGTPPPTVSEPYTLPNGLHFTGGQGSATISGTPAAGTAGRYLITLHAANGVAPAVTQTFVLRIRRS